MPLSTSYHRTSTRAASKEAALADDLLKVHAGEVHVILVSAEVDPFQVGGIKGLVRLEGQGDVDGILVEPGEHEGIQFLTFRLIGGGEDVGDRLIDLCLVLQALLGGVVTVYRGTHGCQRRLGIIRHPPADVEHHVKVARLHVVTVGLLLLAVDVQRDAQLQVFALEVLGDGLFGDAVAVIKEIQSQLLSILGPDTVAPHGPAGFVQQAGGLVHVVGIRLQTHVTVGYSGGIEGIGRWLQTIEDTFGDGLPVGSVLESLPHRLVPQNVMGGIEDNMAGGGGIRQADCELVTVHILADGVGVQHILAEDQIDLPVLQCHDTGLVIRDNFDGDLLDGGLLSPVVFVALKDRILVGNKIREHIGAGADIAVDSILGAAVDHAVGGDHGEGADAGQLGEHGIVWLAHLNDEGIIVRSGHTHQQVHHLQPGVALPVLQDGVEVGQNRVGVAGRTIGESHSIPDVEGVGPAVLTDRPVLGQAAHIALTGVAHQRIIEDALSIHLSRIQMRVQIPDISVVHKDQFVFDSILTTRRSAVSVGLVFRHLTAACQGH